MGKQLIHQEYLIGLNAEMEKDFHFFLISIVNLKDLTGFIQQFKELYTMERLYFGREQTQGSYTRQKKVGWLLQGHLTLEDCRSLLAHYLTSANQGNYN